MGVNNSVKSWERTNVLLIKTPEGISFSILLAGPITRFLAWIIDFYIVMILCNIIGLILKVFSLLDADIANGLIILAYFIIYIGYSIFLEWCWRGQTIGKKLLRIRVMDEQGLRLKFSQVVIRNLFRSVDILPFFYLVGAISLAFSQRSQRIGDFAASTIVTRQPKITVPDLDQILADKYNSFLEHAHLAARLRQNVSPQEAGIALQALIRRDEFDPEKRISLFNEIASHFKSIVEFPEKATLGLTDEQYVRNVVEILFQKQK